MSSLSHLSRTHIAYPSRSHIPYPSRRGIHPHTGGLARTGTGTGTGTETGPERSGRGPVDGTADPGGAGP